MKRRLGFSWPAFWGAIAMAVFFRACVRPDEAPCAWCPPSPCLSDASCADCSCLKAGGSATGVCVSNR